MSAIQFGASHVEDHDARAYVVISPGGIHEVGTTCDIAIVDIREVMVMIGLVVGNACAALP